MNLNMDWAKDLQNVDFNDPSSWPLIFKGIMAGIGCLLIMVAGYYLIISDQNLELERVRAEEARLKETFLQKKALAINLDAYKLQMQEAEETFGVLLKQLPNETEVPDLLIDITQAGLARGLKFDRFKPEKVINRDFYAEMPVNIVVTGTYHQIGEFISDIAALPRIVSVDTFDLASGAGDEGILRMEAVTKTYHYLEE